MQRSRRDGGRSFGGSFGGDGEGRGRRNVGGRRGRTAQTRTERTEAGARPERKTGAGRVGAGAPEASFERGRRLPADAAKRTGGRRDGQGPRRERPAAVNDSASGATETVNSFICGRHPVLEALKSGRSINKLLVSDTSEGGSLIEIIAKARAGGIVVQTVPKAHLQTIAGATHQGVIAFVAPKDYVELDEVIARETSHAPLVVVLDEVSDPYNFGAVLRTCDAVGAQGVVIPKRRAVPLTDTVAKAAAGAVEYVPVSRVSNLVQAITRLKEAGYWVVGADVEGKQMYTEVDYKGPVAVVIGAEGKGLGRLVKEHCDYLVQLPMLGQLQSLNASVATGVLLYEVVRQRQ